MKKLLKVLAVALTLTLALGICGKTDVKADVDAIIDSCRDKWKKAIDDANKQI